MNDVVNPYQPPGQPTDATEPLRDVIPLAGNVSIDDAASLMRVPRIKYVLRVLAIAVLAPMLILSVGMLIVDPSEWITGIAMIAFVLGFAGLILVIERLLSVQYRAQRLIKKHPGLIGPLQGRLDEFGITFLSENTNQYQQISWSAFPDVTVTSAGIRLDWRSADDAFLAIPASCIDRFDESRVAQRLRSCSCVVANRRSTKSCRIGPPHRRTRLSFKTWFISNRR